MNTQSKKEMRRLVKVYFDMKTREKSVLRILDVGSLDVNGTYRTCVPKQWEYIGADLLKGPNVDVVMRSEFHVPLQNNSVDLVISGSCLEHCRNPFKLVKEMARVVKPQGYVFITAPFERDEHKEQEDGTLLVDCWRFLPDGFDCLLKEAKLNVLHTYLMRRKPGKTYCWGIAQK